MGTTSYWTVILGLTAALTLLGGVSAAAAEEDPWNQEQAVKLAKRLADQVGDIRVTMKKAAPGTLGNAPSSPLGPLSQVAAWPPRVDSPLMIRALNRVLPTW